LNSNVSIDVTNLNNIESSTDSDSSNKVNIINKISYNKRNSVVINNNCIDSENGDINISDSKNNSTITNNIMNRSIMKIVLILIIF